MSFSHNLKMLLGVHTLPAGEVASLLGVSTTTLSYWLNDRREPSAENLIEVAQFFEVPATSLMRDEPEQFIRHVGDPERFAKVERELFNLYQPQKAPTPIRKKK